MNWNSVTLAGHTTRDIELRYTPKGAAVGTFGLAVNRTWTTEGGEKKEECSFFDCCCFGRTAETLGQYVKKGHPLFVSGRLKQESWEDKVAGQKRSKVVVIVEQFQFLNKSSKDDGQSERRPASASVAGDGPRPPEDDGDSVPLN